MTHYKAFDKDLCCRGLQFTIGHTTSVEGEVKLNANGIHCCKDALSCLNYYPRDSRFCAVSVDGATITERGITVCGTITVIREVTGDELLILLTGVRKTWHPNGQLQMESNYKDGKMEGVCTRWIINGYRFDESVYKDDRREGPYKQWYPNGQLHIESSYKNDKRDNQTRTYHQDGEELDTDTATFDEIERYLLGSYLFRVIN